MSILPDLIAFEPILLEKVWGGHRLETLLGGGSSGTRYGEAWCLSPLADRPSTVAGGPHPGASLDEVLEGWHRADPDIPSSFPVLIKLLESCAPLSVQLHPSDGQARANGDGLCGKAEAWQVLECDRETRVVHGLKEDVDPGALRRVLEENPEQILDICRQFPARPGDVFPIPPGVVHTILGNMVWVEVQQASDITYRLYDWGRPSAGRPLHKESSVRSARYGVQPVAPIRGLPTRIPGVELLWASPWFVMQRKVVRPGTLDVHQSLEAWVCLEGTGSLCAGPGHTLPLRPGMTFLLPGRHVAVSLDAETPAVFLCVTLPGPEGELSSLLGSPGTHLTGPHLFPGDS